MPTFVALLRGVNVGGAKRVPMADLRKLMAGLGYTGVTTLLNSGNAVFDAAAGTARQHARTLAEAIATGLGVQVPVIVKSSKELSAIVAGNALVADLVDPSRLLVAFAEDAAGLATLAPVAALVKAPEAFLLGPHAAYLHCAGGILESLAGKALLGKVGRAVTTRNWATTLKLQEAARR
jgi:uncharacterized protein (DUF1697 family)